MAQEAYEEKSKEIEAEQFTSTAILPAGVITVYRLIDDPLHEVRVGDWVVFDGKKYSVMTDADFQAKYEKKGV